MQKLRSTDAQDMPLPWHFCVQCDDCQEIHRLCLNAEKLLEGCSWRLGYWQRAPSKLCLFFVSRFLLCNSCVHVPLVEVLFFVSRFLLCNSCVHVPLVEVQKNHRLFKRRVLDPSLERGSSCRR
jgi:hypothetical protein